MSPGLTPADITFSMFFYTAQDKLIRHMVGNRMVGNRMVYPFIVLLEKDS